MSQIIGGGGNALQLSIPTRADVNWDLVMQTALTTITTHTHDGLTLGAAITLAAASVTNAKLAIMAAGTVKANITAGLATPTDVTLAALPVGVTAATPSTTALRDASGGFVGVATSSNAATGSVGELLGPISRSQPGVAISAGAPAAVCTTNSITLTPGDWDVRAMVGFLPLTTTSFTQLVMAVNTSVNIPGTTDGVPAAGIVRQTISCAAQVTGASPTTYSIAPYRVTVAVASTLQLFLVAQANFTVSTMNVFGSMEARRIR